MYFSELVKLARKQTGMSQEELARAINVSFATINRWENGKNIPNKLAQSVFLEFCTKHKIVEAESGTVTIKDRHVIFSE